MGCTKKIKTFLFLHLIIFIYSACSVLSKSAAQQPFLSPKFILLYGGMILVLGVYAVLWQQVLKKMQLNVAYANKAVAIIWGMLWGVLFFGETLSAQNVIGAALVLFGVVLMAVDEDKKHE